MSVQGDNLKIPIEIKTDDLNEIRKLINDITEAEIDLKSIKPRKGRGKDDSSRSAFTQQDDTRGGIFGGQQGDALPTQGRDKSSKTPVQKENQFAKLQQDVAQQEQKLSGLDALQGGVGGISQGLGFASLLGGPSGGKGALGALTGAAGKAFLPLAVITSIVGIAQTVLKNLLAPGGLMDRRFRREAREESSNLTNLKEKAEFSNGRRVIRVTTIGGQRGTSSQSRSNLDYIKNGVDVFDVNGVFNKAIGAGSI